MDEFTITKGQVEKTLASEGMSLDDYNTTVMGFTHDGVEWQLLEDSLDRDEALAWARRASGYGETVGLYAHTAE